nr:hypothetical protein [Bradyrhizobium sp. 160]
MALEALDFTVWAILCRGRMGAPEGGPRTHQDVFRLRADPRQWRARA